VAATAIVQSSAASIVMVQALVVGGGITEFESVFPFILGAQVGTCITALLASMRVSLSARRAAIAHLVFNIIGCGIAVALAPVYFWLMPRLTASMPLQIAVGHSIIQTVNAFLFLAVAPLYARFITWIMPGRDIYNAAPEYLDYALVGEAGRALDCARQEVRRMFATCNEMMADAVKAFLASNERQLTSVVKREGLVDDLYRTIAEYLLRVSRQAVAVEQALQLQMLLQVMSDVERIGDHADNVTELTSMYAAEHVRLNASAEAEVEDLAAKVAELAALVEPAFDVPNSASMPEVLRSKRVINDTVDTVLDNHAVRLGAGSCRPVSGLVFVELVMNLRRVANHLRNIAAGLSLEQPQRTAPIHRLKQELALDREHDAAD
jgi:phosphate:Na+ symporter